MLSPLPNKVEDLKANNMYTDIKPKTSNTKNTNSVMHSKFEKL